MAETYLVSIPEELENMKLPNPAMINYYKNLNERTLWIDDEITDLTLDIAEQIIVWNREDKGKPVEERKPIKLFIFSPGGDIDVMNTMVDTILLSKTPVYGYNMGMAASAAGIIFLSCHKRFMLPRACFLFHKGSGAVGGNFREAEAAMKAYKLEVDAMVDFIKERTHYTPEEVEKFMENDYYIHSAEAVEKGVCESVVKSLDEVI